MSLYELQTNVHVRKDRVNEFGGYNYRTAEGILAAIKASLPEGATIIVTDDVREVAGQIFVSATATITFSGGTAHSASGHAMHPLSKKGMDPSQITGAASSYARKYALAGLMALDDGSADPDAAKTAYESEPPPPFNVKAATDRIIDKIKRQVTADKIDAVWAEEKDTRGDIKDASEDEYKRLQAAAGAAKKALIKPPKDDPGGDESGIPY
ncbi:MAG: ERF family protein [Paracoccaceae bacterium]